MLPVPHGAEAPLVAVDVGVAVRTTVCVGVGVALNVAVGVGVLVAARVLVAVGVNVLVILPIVVPVGVFVAVAVAAGVVVLVGVGVRVAVLEAVGVAVGVLVSCAVLVAVIVGVGVRVFRWPRELAPAGACWLSARAKATAWFTCAVATPPARTRRPTSIEPATIRTVSQTPNKDRHSCAAVKSRRLPDRYVSRRGLSWRTVALLRPSLVMSGGVTVTLACSVFFDNPCDGVFPTRVLSSIVCFAILLFGIGSSLPLFSRTVEFDSGLPTR